MRHVVEPVGQEHGHLLVRERCLCPAVVREGAVGRIPQVENDGSTRVVGVGQAGVAPEEGWLSSVVAIDKSFWLRNEWERYAVVCGVDLGVVEICAIGPGVRQGVAISVPGDNKLGIAGGLNVGPER